MCRNTLRQVVRRIVRSVADATIGRAIRRRTRLLRSVTRQHDWSYDRSSDAMTGRKIGRRWSLPLVARSPTTDRAIDILQSYDQSPKTNRSRPMRRTASGDSSRHCWSVQLGQIATNRTIQKSCDPVCVRSPNESAHLLDLFTITSLLLFKSYLVAHFHTHVSCLWFLQINQHNIKVNARVTDFFTDNTFVSPRPVRR